MIMPIIITNALFAAAATFTVLLYLRRKLNFLTKTVSESGDAISEMVWTAGTIDAHVDATISLPRPNGWTLDAAAIATLCQILENERPRVVVELGSGLSTPIIGAAMQNHGGRLISVDHDRTFAEATRSHINTNGLQDVVEIRIAELQEISSESRALWYDQSALTDIHEIDLLLIDGPPKPVDPMIRQHALPFFLNKLAPSATVILDDANRDGEKKIIDQWRTDYPVKDVQVRGFPKSHAIMTLGNGQNSE